MTTEEPSHPFALTAAQQRLQESIGHLCAKPFFDITPNGYVVIKGGRGPFWL